MSATRARRPVDDDAVPQMPQSTPASLGYGGSNHDFTLQAVMEMQKSVGELNANMQAMRSSLDGLKGKVDDLVGWKNKILGGVAVLLAVSGFVGWALAKASDYVTIRVPAGTSTVIAPVAPPPQGK